MHVFETKMLSFRGAVRKFTSSTVLRAAAPQAAAVCVFRKHNIAPVLKFVVSAKAATCVGVISLPVRIVILTISPQNNFFILQ